jgi:hypothetical protein
MYYAYQCNRINYLGLIFYLACVCLRFIVQKPRDNIDNVVFLIKTKLEKGKEIWLVYRLPVNVLIPPAIGVLL